MKLNRIWIGVCVVTIPALTGAVAAVVLRISPPEGANQVAALLAPDSLWVWGSAIILALVFWPAVWICHQLERREENEKAGAAEAAPARVKGD